MEGFLEILASKCKRTRKLGSGIAGTLGSLVAAFFFMMLAKACAKPLVCRPRCFPGAQRLQTIHDLARHSMCRALHRSTAIDLPRYVALFFAPALTILIGVSLITYSMTRTVYGSCKITC